MNEIEMGIKFFIGIAIGKAMIFLGVVAAFAALCGLIMLCLKAYEWGESDVDNQK